MNYKITSFDKRLGKISVQYLHNNLDLQLRDMEIPIVNKRFITGVELETFIQANAPTHLLTRYEEITLATNFDYLESKVVA